MAKPLQVLIIEDSPDDAELILRELRRGGFDPHYQRVDAAVSFQKALDSQEWDILLCDYTMAGFGGTQALTEVRERGLDVPFIFVSGTIGEETAVAAMRAGAQDYVIKDNLKRLVPVIERELRDADTRRQRARAETARRAAEARFRDLLAMAPDAIVAVGEDQRITIFNRAAEALFGYSAEEIHGQPLELLLPRRLADLHRQNIENFAKSPAPYRFLNERSEILGRRKNGEEFPAEASLSKLSDQNSVTLMIVVWDITERKRNEATLRKLYRAVDHSASLIVITDNQGVIEYANTSFLGRMGYEAGDVVGKLPSIWKSSARGSTDYADLWHTILSGRDWRGEFINRCKNGSTVHVSATISPIKDHNGHITHFISVQEDVTERRALEEQLHQAQKMEAVGQLTGGLAHDFNNLLTVIIGNLDLLADVLKTNPQAQTLAQYALDAGMRGAELTRQLLAFSRRQALDPKVIDLNKLASGVIQLLRRTLGEQVEIDLYLADGLWAALADPAQVESALANLAINARDAMPLGGHLTIETANKILDKDYADDNVGVSPGQYVMLAVTDTGTGMSPEILAKVFEPFFTTKDKGRGTGLGLSMVYGFAKQSGGHVKIYSEVGHGTTVRLYLPVAASALATAPEEDDVVDDTPGGEAVLVVEDNPDVRRMVVSQLRALGYEVLDAADGAEALIVLESQTPLDLLFTDVVMPGGLLGPDLAREARRLRPGIKVLFSSGYTEAALNGGNGNGPEAVLHKPYRKKDLAHKVREVLGSTKDKR